MSEFNNEMYLQGQIKKQHIETKVTRCKVSVELENLVKIDAVKYDSLILGKSIEELQQYVKEGILDYPSILLFYLNRIQKYQSYNALLEVNAKSYEESLKKHYSEDHAMVYGLPVIIKGNIGTKEMYTSAGVAALKSLICDDDAEIIRKLKEKGAIIIGKANLSEWANFMSTESSNGYSAVGGQTMNPYGNFDVGGSSSGSGVSIALELAPLTIGTETAGSIIYPASQNSTVGLKPTLGLVSQNRIIPISKTHDTAGPMTKCVKDAYYLLEGMVDDLPKADWHKNHLNKKTFGIVSNSETKDLYRDEDESILQKVQIDLMACDARVINQLLVQSAFDTQVYDILKYEFREGVQQYLNDYASHHFIQSIDDVLRFNNEDMSVYAPFDHEILHEAATEQYDENIIQKQIIANNKMTSEALDKAFESVDYLVTLSNYCTSVYAPSGYPAITVPAGYRHTGEPIGVTFIGPKNDDIKLIEIAYVYEQFTNHRRRPGEVL